MALRFLGEDMKARPRTPVITQALEDMAAVLRATMKALATLPQNERCIRKRLWSTFDVG